MLPNLENSSFRRRIGLYNTWPRFVKPFFHSSGINFLEQGGADSAPLLFPPDSGHGKGLTWRQRILPLCQHAASPVSLHGSPAAVQDQMHSAPLPSTGRVQSSVLNCSGRGSTTKPSPSRCRPNTNYLSGVHAVRSTNGPSTSSANCRSNSVSSTSFPSIA